MKKLLLVLVILVLLIGGAGGALYFWYEKQLDVPASDSSALAEIEIEKGEGVKAIALKLKSAGVITNPDVFYFYVKLNHLGPKIQAGKFQIPKNLTIVEVAEAIQKAAGNDIWITFQEGLRLDEIATVLETYFLKEENSKFDKDEFLNITQNPDNYNLTNEILDYKPEGASLEGFLFPDTYNVRKDITSLELVELFISNLEGKLKSEKVDITSSSTLSAYEVLNMASIIEREARSSEERYMISDILQKRLQGEMDGVKLLQADATLLYEEKDWSAVVTKELKEKDTPYNTYKYTGLPPTPICNPGIDSIKATLNPTENDYFFYLHDDEGKIHYAVSLTEQTNNVRCYINKNKDYCL